MLPLQNSVRRARPADIPRILELLHQVNMVHHALRPDLFKPYTTKYSAQELQGLLADESKPIFVYDDGQQVLGYAFCQITKVSGHHLLQDVTTLYIDDICVDETARGRHVGTALYRTVLSHAQTLGCHHVTLNVWEGNTSAQHFYQSMGMTVQKTTMEILIPH